MNGSEQPFSNKEICNEERLQTANHCGTLCTYIVSHAKYVVHSNSLSVPSARDQQHWHRHGRLRPPPALHRGSQDLGLPVWRHDELVLQDTKARQYLHKGKWFWKQGNHFLFTLCFQILNVLPANIWLAMLGMLIVLTIFLKVKCSYLILEVYLKGFYFNSSSITSMAPRYSVAQASAMSTTPPTLGSSSSLESSA